MLDQPRRMLARPEIRPLLLVAVVDLLPEEPVFVVDAVAVSRHVEAGQRIQKTGGQPSQPAVSKSGIGFDLQNVGQAQTDFGKRLVHRL